MKKILTSLLCLLCLQLFAQPANDEPCGAITISGASSTGICTPSIGLSWADATASTTTPTPSCGQWGAGKNDVWYKFVPTAGTNTINIRTAGASGTTDVIMSMYTAATCAGPFTQVICSDDFTGAMPGYDSVDVIAGQTYYLRISQYNASNSSGSMTICIQYFFSPPAIDPTKRVGINIDQPQANLDVNGSAIIRGDVKISSGQPGLAKVLTSDATGNATWQFIPSAPVSPTIAFNAQLDSNRTLFQNVDTKLNFFASPTGISSFNIGNAFNNTTDVFTAPSAGQYKFNVRLSAFIAAQPYSLEIFFRVNNQNNQDFHSLINVAASAPGQGQVVSILHEALLNLAASDKVEVIAKLTTSTVNSAIITFYGNSVLNSTFNGYKL